ncbi:hypothetical protein WSK_0633 [Novosphingobium sp. Rr 2-17]|uniref:hypothetical protein n=1 Tax=Novosphingobium sp. Rr 2-17 TaxID=555793 RepID=UPI000269A7BA|nr:hypothetical protein [Novosphingobium sp. Rr 2-17]EIZ80660.1 hypothetical protein WSK_0633 [Novosphingobium sp. Rr 2-17]
MTKIDYDWGLSNPGPDQLMVWLEPWAEEFVVPVRSTVALKASGRAEAREIGDIEWASDHIVIWASATIVQVFIDDVLQDSASAAISVPEGLSRGMLNILFKGQPSARLGGAASHPKDQPSWRERLWRWLRLN